MCSVRAAQGRERIKDIVGRILCVPPETIRANARFHEDLGADSLDLVEIVFAVHREFADVDKAAAPYWHKDICFHTVEEAVCCFCGEQVELESGCVPELEVHAPSATHTSAALD